VRWRWLVTPLHPGLVRPQFGYERPWERVPTVKIHIFEIMIGA
jgi:hypothetical protein